MNKLEKKTEQYFEHLGFLVHTVRKPGLSYRKDEKGELQPIRNSSADHDIFNLYDHVAVYNKDIGLSLYLPDHNKKIIFNFFCRGVTLFLQTKSRRIYGRDIEKYQSFPGKSFLVVWTKKENGRYDEPYMEVLTP